MIFWDLCDYRNSDYALSDYRVIGDFGDIGRSNGLFQNFIYICKLARKTFVYFKITIDHEKIYG